MSRKAAVDPAALLQHHSHMVLTALFVISGLVLLIWPRPIVRKMRGRRAERLADLGNGGADQFFEVRRSLETYPVTTTPGILRVLGVGSILIGVVGAFSGRL